MPAPVNKDKQDPAEELHELNIRLRLCGEEIEYIKRRMEEITSGRKHGSPRY